MGGSRPAPGSSNDEERLSLAMRLKVPADGAAEGSLLPMQLLRKYIAYAREHVHPVLSDEAKEILQVRLLCGSTVASVKGGLEVSRLLCLLVVQAVGIVSAFTLLLSSHSVFQPGCVGPASLCLPCRSYRCGGCAQTFYLSLRSSSCGGISGSLPITARQLESLVRLAEARARVELRETVTADDAQVRRATADRASHSTMAGSHARNGYLCWHCVLESP